MDESRIGQYSISVTTYPIMALLQIVCIYNLMKLAYVVFQHYDLSIRIFSLARRLDMFFKY